MPVKRRIVSCFLLLSFALFGACGGDDIDPNGASTLFEVVHDDITNQLHVILHPGLPSGHTLHVQVRNGEVGFLDCGVMASTMPRIDGALLAGWDSNGGVRFAGPFIDASVYELPFDDTWLDTAGPTADMIAQAQVAFHTIDICLMADGKVVRGAEMDVRRALDRAGTGKFDGYGDPNEVIESVVAYAQACVSQIGEIPFFEPLGEGDYSTYSCLDSTPIPTVVTSPDGEVFLPEEEVDTCDNPQFIYSLCEPNAVAGRTNGPRVARATNEQGTEWVLLCRKSKEAEGEYNDIAMVGTNPYTGITCFFQNGLYVKRDGLHVPHPGDEVDSPASPQQSATLWSGIQGGIGSGIQCVTCHDSDPLIHTPWIDGAKDERGEPVIPKMGIHDGFAQGFNEAPYTLVDLEGQGWTMPKVLVSEEAAACTKCHRIGDGRWTKQWLSRLEGDDVSWNELLTPSHRAFEHVYWMPPEVEGIDEETWAESEYGRAMTFIRGCANTSFSRLSTVDEAASDAACQWEELPTQQIVDQGEPPTTDLEALDLANEALKILGSSVKDLADPRCQGDEGSCATRRCSECHSVGKGGLRHWKKLTTTAKTQCGLGSDPETLTAEEATDVLNCLRSRPDEPDSVFAADKIGVLATGARYGYFRKLFQKAYGDTDWLPNFIRFKARVSMPKGTYSALSELEYAVVTKWFDQGLPHLDQLIVDPPAPTTCEQFFDTEALSQHIDDMKFDGWGAVNKEAGIFMFGCEGATNTSDCFSKSYKDRSGEWGNGAGQLIEVTQLQFRTSFWTRSSADGRFVANGGGTSGGATVTDMVRGLDIKVKSSYDPGFFPDNSGFIFQGGGFGTAICTQGMLGTATEEIDYKDPGCIKGTNINLYQHVARGLNGGDYFIINSQFTSDSGRSATKDPVAHFDANSTMKFSPMIFNGTNYEQLSAVIVDSPYEGDSVLSPSTRMVVSRLAGGEDGGSLGYVIRTVETEKFESNYKVEIDNVLARICTSGAKANISYDERFMVTHHYESDGSANILFIDLSTGIQTQVTNMPAGAKALFPHFRSDGWFYFLVRQGEDEFVVASDLAVTAVAGASTP